MRIVFSLPLVVVLAGAVVSGCSGGEMRSGTSIAAPRQQRASLASEMNPEGPPPIEQISIQDASGRDTGGFRFAPPLDPNPSLSGEEAIAQAWQRFVGTNKPSSVSAVLENVSWGDDSDALKKDLNGRDVWVVTYPDACPFVFGPSSGGRGDRAGGTEPGAASLKEQDRPQAETNLDQSVPDDPADAECEVALQSFSTILDAQTGEFFVSFAPGISST